MLPVGWSEMLGRQLLEAVVVTGRYAADPDEADQIA